MESKYFPFLVTYLSFKLDESLFTQHKSRENPFVHCSVLFHSLLLHRDFSLLYFSSISLIKNLTKNAQDSKFKTEKKSSFKHTTPTQNCSFLLSGPKPRNLATVCGQDFACQLKILSRGTVVYITECLRGCHFSRAHNQTTEKPQTGSQNPKTMDSQRLGFGFGRENQQVTPLVGKTLSTAKTCPA